MALSWADHRRMEDSQPGMVKLPDGSLIMTGQKPVQAKPGMLAGLRDYFAAKLNPQPTQDQYWIAQPAPVATAPVQAGVAPGAPLPPYSAWGEIEDMVVKEKAIADQLGPVSKKIMDSKELIEGRWF